MKVQVCIWKACKSKFSNYIVTRLENDVKKFNLSSLEIETCSCTGNCKKAPNVLFDTTREEYVTPSKASKKVLDTIKK